MVNQSFIDVSEILTSSYIKNNSFFLKTFLDVTDETIYDECVINPWYYFREIVMVPNDDSVNGKPFTLNQSNLAFIYLSLNKINNMVLDRNYDVVTSVAVYLSWHVLFGNNALLINNKYLDGHKLFDKLCEIISLLPDKFKNKCTISEDHILRDDIKICSISKLPVRESTLTDIMNENLGVISVYPGITENPLGIKILNPFRDSNYYEISYGNINRKELKGSESTSKFISSSCTWHDGIYDLDIRYVQQWMAQRSNTKTLTVYIPERN